MVLVGEKTGRELGTKSKGCLASHGENRRTDLWSCIRGIDRSLCRPDGHQQIASREADRRFRDCMGSCVDYVFHLAIDEGVGTIRGPWRCQDIAHMRSKSCRVSLQTEVETPSRGILNRVTDWTALVNGDPGGTEERSCPA